MGEFPQLEMPTVSEAKSLAQDHITYKWCDPTLTPKPTSLPRLKQMNPSVFSISEYEERDHGKTSSQKEITHFSLKIPRDIWI